MDSEEFRRLARETVDWMARYLSGVERYPVFPQIDPGALRAALEAAPPDEGEPMEAVLEDFREHVVPAVTHWAHPAFLGYFPSAGSGPGILGEMLSAALNINAMVWRSSPAGTELEELVTDWLRDWIGLPRSWAGVIQDTASSSSLTALVAARRRALPASHEEGLFGMPRARVYASTEAHSSIDKAALTLGLGSAGVRKIAADGDYAMDVDALRSALVEDVEAGVRPMAIVATLGTTSTTGIDPVDAIADVAEEFGVWLHVDAAYAGAAAVVPRLQRLFKGWARADSVVVNPHKWLFTPIDCSVLLMADAAQVRSAFRVAPAFLSSPGAEEATDLMDYGIALGRRFRALKLWFVMRYFGREGVVARIEEHIRLAIAFSTWVNAEPHWRTAARTRFGLVVFRYQPDGWAEAETDELNATILQAANGSGRVFLTHTRLSGRFWIRMAVGNLRTRESHVAEAWELLTELAKHHVGERGSV